MISNKVLEFKNGQMELNIKVTSIKDSKMDMEHFCGQMVADTRENSRAIS